jgi:hypothetical protein
VTERHHVDDSCGLDEDYPVVADAQANTIAADQWLDIAGTSSGVGPQLPVVTVSNTPPINPECFTRRFLSPYSPLSFSGLSRGSSSPLAPAPADGWMVGTSPTMTQGKQNQPAPEETP